MNVFMMNEINMKRELYLKLTINWEGYEDVSDDLILEDVFENYKPKDGTNLTLVNKPEPIKPKTIILSGYQPLDNLDTSNPPNGDY